MNDNKRNKIVETLIKKYLNRLDEKERKKKQLRTTGDVEYLD